MNGDASMSMPPRMPDKAELQDLLNYTLVALVGMLGGFIIGYIFGYGARKAPVEGPPPAVQRP
jgi:hypothetical protein